MSSDAGAALPTQVGAGAASDVGAALATQAGAGAASDVGAALATQAGAVTSPAVVLPTAEDTRAWGARLGRVLRPGDLLVLTGELGAGKTTLTQGIADGLGVRGPITSPTFVIARVHPSLVGGPALVHVDAYRLGGFAELDDLDLDASLDEAVTVVEWGHGLAEGLSESYLELVLLVPDPAAGAGSDDTGTGSDDSGTRSDHTGTRSDDTGTGPDHAETGSDHAETGSGDDAETRTVLVAPHGDRWCSPEAAEVLGSLLSLA